MNEEYQSDYKVRLDQLINARRDVDSILEQAQVADANNATHIINESEKLNNIEQDAWEDWKTIRDQYLQ